MFVSGNSRPSYGQASAQAYHRPPISAMQMMMVVLGLMMISGFADFAAYRLHGAFGNQISDQDSEAADSASLSAQNATSSNQTTADEAVATASEAAGPASDIMSASSSSPPKYEGTASASEQALMDKEGELEEECRGGEGNVDAVCAARDRAYDDLNRAGWCFGRPGQNLAERTTWYPCR